MNRPQRSIEIFTISALDLFVTAMGSFAILMMILFPYYTADKLKAERKDQTPPDRETSGDDTATLAKGDVLFCAWPTRVQDYEEFVRDTGYRGDPRFPDSPEATQRADSWRNPGFSQESTHPVVGVSWVDARAFCKWLTKKERDAGAIGPEDEYRLPTDEEWSAAAGPGKYPWGEQWPLPENSGNFSGAEFAVPLGYAPVGGNYRDEFVFTSPVGSFPANPYGLYDMAGNVAEWCLDWFRNDMNPPALRAAVPFLKDDMPEKTRRVMRGSPWQVGFEPRLQTAFRNHGPQDGRWDDTGFRCVLVVRSGTHK